MEAPSSSAGSIASTVGAMGLALFIVGAFMTGKIVPESTYKATTLERDEYKKLWQEANDELRRVLEGKRRRR